MGFSSWQVSDRSQENELKVIHEEDNPSEDVLRLTEAEKTVEAKPVDRLPVAPTPEEATRLDVDGTDGDRRSHEPDISVIIAPHEESVNPEEGWTGSRKPAPYGWFTLIALLVVLAAVGPTLINRGDQPTEAEIAREAASKHHEDETQADREARELVEAAEQRISGYLKATNADELLAHVRHPERVGPLMQAWHAKNPLVPWEFCELKHFSFTDIGTQTFWNAEVAVSNERDRWESLTMVILEQTDETSVVIDWEASTCQQPMPWGDYLRERPEGNALDFRVILAGNSSFYSHEFSDDTVWHALRLVAAGSETSAIAYVKRGSDLEWELYTLFQNNSRQPTPMVLRLSIPKGTQSPHGIVIEDIVSPHWVIADPE